jgi:hypothetical protein
MRRVNGNIGERLLPPAGVGRAVSGISFFVSYSVTSPRNVEIEAAWVGTEKYNPGPPRKRVPRDSSLNNSRKMKCLTPDDGRRVPTSGVTT